MSDLDRVLDKLDENNRLLNRFLSNGGTPTTTGGGTNSNGDTSLFQAGIKGAVGTLSDLASGQADATTVLNVFTGIIGKLGGIGSVAADAIGKMGTGVIHANQQLAESSRFGATFNQNLGDYNLLVKEGQLTFEQWNDILKKASPMMAAIGGNVNLGSAAFLKMSKDFTESSVGIHLQRLGITSEELADTQTLFTMQQRGINIRSKENQEIVETSLQNFAAQLQAVAELTGVSSAQQKKDLERQMQKGEVELYMLRQTQPWKDAYNSMTTVALAGMPKMQDLATALATHSKLTTEQINTFSMMGPAAKAAIQDLTNNLGKGTEEEQTQRVIRLQLALKENAYSNELLGATRAHIDGSQDMAHESVALAGRINALKTIYDDKGNKIGTRTDAEATEMAVRQEYARVRELTKNVTNDQIKTVSEILNDTTRLGKLAGGAIAKEFKELNDEAQKGIMSHQDVVQKLNQLLNTADMKNLPPEIMDKVSTAISGHPTANPANVPTNMTPANASPGSLAEAISAKFTTSSPLPVTVINPTRRDNGSMGTVGTPTEKFGLGTMIEVHGDDHEGIWTKNQLTSLASNARQTGVESAMASMLGQFKAGLSVNNKDVANLESSFKPLVDGLMGNVKTMISEIKIQPKEQKESESKPPVIEASMVHIEPVMKDIKEQLVQLNTAMTKVVTNTSEHIDIASKHVDATNKLSGNRF